MLGGAGKDGEGLGRAERCWDRLRWTGVRWAGVRWTGVGCDGLGCLHTHQRGNLKTNCGHSAGRL